MMMSMATGGGREAAVEKSWPPPGMRTNGCGKGGQWRATDGEGNGGYGRVVEGYVEE